MTALELIDGLFKRMSRGSPGGQVVFHTHPCDTTWLSKCVSAGVEFSESHVPSIVPEKLSGTKTESLTHVCNQWLFTMIIREKAKKNGKGKHKSKVLHLKDPCVRCSKEEKDTPAKFYELDGPSAFDALYLTRATLEVLEDYSSKFSQKFSSSQQMEIYRVASKWNNLDFVAYAKYFTAYGMAKFLKQDLPKKPDGFSCSPLIFTGAIKRYLKARLISKKPQSAYLFHSFLQGIKRGAAPVSPSYVQRAYEKHRVAMGTYPPALQNLLEGKMSWADSQDSYEQDSVPIEKKITKIFKNFSPPKPRLFEASTSASFQSTRSDGGARDEIVRDIAFGDFSSTVSTSPDLDFYHSSVELAKELGVDFGGVIPFNSAFVECSVDRIIYSDDLLLMHEGKPGKVDELRGHAISSFSEIKDLYKTDPGFITGIAKGTTSILEDGTEVKDYSNISFHPKEKLPVMVAAICEPLKVRLITKGDAGNYWLSKFYQKGLWKHLQKFPQFSPTGNPLNQTDLYDLLDRERKIYPLGFDLWVSGDYSAATDGISIDFTKHAFEQSLQAARRSKNGKFYDEDLIRSLRAVIYEQTVHYPEKTGLEPIDQVNGQLMGSTLSFPLLCIINLCAYWDALEEHLKIQVEPKDLPVLVNGDDILFRTSPEMYKIWLRKIKAVGFNLSLGKNYVHKTYLTINSMLFRHSKKSVQVNGIISQRDSFDEIHYLNTGLLTGQSKVTGRSALRVSPLWDFYNQTIPVCRNPVRAHKRFLYYHKDKIDEITANGKYNLFIPRERGGLGFDPVVFKELHDPVKNPGTTVFQRQFALFIWQNTLDQISDHNEKGTKIDLDSIALVRKERDERMMLSHYHSYPVNLLPPTMPLPSNVVPFKSFDLDSPILALRYLDDNLLKVRLPKKRTLREFSEFKKKFPGKEMSERVIYDYNYQLCFFLNLENPSGFVKFVDKKEKADSEELGYQLSNCNPFDWDLNHHYSHSSDRDYPFHGLDSGLFL